MSVTLRYKLKLPINVLSEPIRIEVGDGRTVPVTTSVSGVTIEIDGSEFPMTCLVMTIPSFDVVLGMDWLIRHKASIECDKKIIYFPLADGTRAVAQGERGGFNCPLISMMKVKKSLAKGCDSFLAYVIDAKKEKKSVSDIPIVSEFPEVFRDELPGLPPVREVEYKIELLPGSTPVVKALYRLAPSEIRDMMSQIQELLDQYGGSWDSHLPLIEFAYNNSYHSSIGKPPYEMLYGRRCRTPTCWLKAGEKHFVGPEIVQQTADKVAIAREKLKDARDRQKIYAEPRRQPLTFSVGERVYLKVSPWKGVIRFGKRGKLAPRYLGPFNIRQMLNDQTVVLDLPAELAGIHDTFNICYLRKCKVDDESQILALQDLKVDMNKKLVEEPVKIVDRKVTKLRKKQIPIVLVEWKHTLGSNLTWETEELMKARYPPLFDLDQISRMKSS
ncbi:uncharacterized protein [Rutidosis leptorrhynchoides]|uniref:uncharacterized protein n=1 Tax=Rutidosis leptorrhynchoides TaxID=125765 RepID=UPI003A9A593D